MYPIFRLIKDTVLASRMERLPITGLHVSHHICWPWDLDMWMELNNGRTFFANGTYSYRSAYTFDPVAAYEQSPTHLVDAAIGLRGDEWEAQLWATNLLNEDYLSNYFLFGATNFGIAAPGRTIGFSVKREW